MSDFTAKDVKALRDATGAGMMDAKKALTEADGDMDAARKVLREKGLAKAGTRTDRENTEGAIAVATGEGRAAIAQLKSETDFAAKNDAFASLTQQLADDVLANGESALEAAKDRIDDLKVTIKENIEAGRAVLVEAGGGNILDTYLHTQEGRGVNAVIVELAGGTPELAHDLAVHIAFTKPSYVSREQVPEAEVAEERATLEDLTRKEGKPEQAIDKIVDGRLTSWFQEQVLMEQKFVRDEKQTVRQLLGDAELVRFEQVLIGI
jgi:elongation factor Ts